MLIEDAMKSPQRELPLSQPNHLTWHIKIHDYIPMKEQEILQRVIAALRQIRYTPSLTEIARRAHVSASSVKRIVAGQYVRESTWKAVERALIQYGQIRPS